MKESSKYIMNKFLKITLNILIFALIAGFGYYMIHSITSEKKISQSNEENIKENVNSPYKKINSFNANSHIISFDISENLIYVAQINKVSVFDLSGNPQFNFKIEANIRDLRVENNTIYLLYPAKIELYTPNGVKIEEWKDCSDNSGYCSFTTTKDYVFVTDAENKHIVQYDKQGQFMRFIKSPHGFIIPSYTFGIININDTIYCSNSGRHKIESYTLDGEFITSFGKIGTETGAFTGCCNPVYLEKTLDGNILTSEKGIPRISCYGRDGKFRGILFDSHILGGGTTAYRIKVSEENIFIAGKNTISVYCSSGKIPLAPTANGCAGCEKQCPFNANHSLPL